MRDSTSVPFLLGWSSTDDREKKYHELGAPWPFVVFRRGDTANTDRVWPFYSYATNQFLESTWYMWPIYKYNRVHSDPLADAPRPDAPPDSPPDAAPSMLMNSVSGEVMIAPT